MVGTSHLLLIRLVAKIPRGRQGGDCEIIWVFTVADFGFLDQGVQLLLGNILHPLPIGGGLQAGTEAEGG